MGKKAVSLVGKKFGNLIVTSRAEARFAKEKPHWVCKCKCDKRVVVSGAALRKGQLFCSLQCSLYRADQMVDGFRISSAKVPDYIRKGYKSWADQRQRCNNPKDPRYRWWGAKGIQVEYDAREFVEWYANQWKARGPFKRPNVSRIDHDQNYRFGNIQLLECSENSKEAGDRGNGAHATTVRAVNMATGEVSYHNGYNKASLATGVAKSGIQWQCKKRILTPIQCGWVFSIQD